LPKKNISQPTNTFHPRWVEEFLQPGKITQAAFARKIDWTKARLNEFVRGKRVMTADHPHSTFLGEALGSSARLWMNLQST
jgi:antitoxin HigA-1